MALLRTVEPEVQSVSTAVARKKQEATSQKQYNFRADPELAERIDSVVKAMGLDAANFLRQFILEFLPEYEYRAEQIRERRRKT